MPGGDSLSSRFDYLFEPLDDEEPVDDALDAGYSSYKPAPSAAPVRMSEAAPLPPEPITETLRTIQSVPQQEPAQQPATETRL